MKGFLAVIVWAVTRLSPVVRSGEIGEDTYLQLRGELTSTG
jgi:hypothetical protein